jgi:quercetin dioxygenase-like cupin family protein
MKLSARRYIPAILAGSLFASLVPAQQRDSVTVTRLYTGFDGQTHAERTEVRLAPGARGLGRSPLVKATGIFYLKLPAGQVQEWHTAPRRQYLIELSGRSEIELGDGEKILIDPGTVILAEDLTGKGHLSRCVGTQDCIAAEVPLAE